MRDLIILVLAMFSLALVPACSDSDTGDSSSSDGSGSGSGNGSGNGAGNGSGSDMNCASQHECVNGACECTTTGKEGTSCCDPDDCGTDSNNCDDVCTVCS